MGLAVLVTAVGLGHLPALWVMLGGLFGSIVVLFAYSYLVWRNDPANQPSGAGR